jgi:muramoyltetrapeptide carboxypeptidase
MKTGIIATSSAVPLVELDLGVEHLRAAGLDLLVHPQCRQQHFTFAGTDRARAEALLEYAFDPSIDVIWAARGGYGATRLLPLLEEMAGDRKPPRKLLVGYSDLTALHEFVRRRWNWAGLHAPMPAANNFPQIKSDELAATIALVRRQRPQLAWEHAPLSFIGDAPKQPLRAPVLGGNLAVWNCLIGTPYAPRAHGAMLFFEDIGEAYYRIDRIMIQLVQSGGLDEVRAILLGDFTNCTDEKHMVLAERPDPSEPGEPARKPLRPWFEREEAFDEIFGTLSRRLGIPFATGMPVGHGPNFWPLPLGGEYELTPEGHLKLRQWDWL